jgi:hypothetical protein
MLFVGLNNLALWILMRRSIPIRISVGKASLHLAHKDVITVMSTQPDNETDEYFARIAS